MPFPVLGIIFSNGSSAPESDGGIQTPSANALPGSAPSTLLRLQPPSLPPTKRGILPHLMNNLTYSRTRPATLHHRPNPPKEYQNSASAITRRVPRHPSFFSVVPSLHKPHVPDQKNKQQRSEHDHGVDRHLGRENQEDEQHNQIKLHVIAAVIFQDHATGMAFYILRKPRAYGCPASRANRH